MLDKDKWKLSKKDLMVGFIDYFKDQWTGKFIEKRYLSGKNNSCWNYVESVLTEGTKTISAKKG
ncbi:hypothetical protein DSO57_1015165 [Entomophthora muscae]|uniref:Uncharacterized protein n=1 Tax=Entomophthora muscae TaxID=34485 RepID=A0ACC2RJR5_9FUNG|nr:hypothetical protein DSO57_1015165 [Entomophthora muscae]